MLTFVQHVVCLTLFCFFVHFCLFSIFLFLFLKLPLWFVFVWIVMDTIYSCKFNVFCLLLQLLIYLSKFFICFECFWVLEWHSSRIFKLMKLYFHTFLIFHHRRIEFSESIRKLLKCANVAKYFRIYGFTCRVPKIYDFWITCKYSRDWKIGLDMDVSEEYASIRTKFAIKLYEWFILAIVEFCLNLWRK